MRYPEYLVSFHGIGPGPLDQSHLGCVSQLALFVRSDFWNAISHPATVPNTSVPSVDSKILQEIAFEDTNECLGDASEQIIKLAEYDENDINPEKLTACSWEYKLIYRHVYPINVDTRSREQRLLDEAKYHISRYEYMDDTYLNFDRYVYEVPLLLVSQNIVDENHTIDELRYVLCSPYTTRFFIIILIVF